MATVVDSAVAVSESFAYYRRTRRGHVLRIVEESYLRNDLGLGSRHGKTLNADEMTKLLSSSGIDTATNDCSWLIPDTNVVLHQMDLLEVLLLPMLLPWTGIFIVVSSPKVNGCAFLDHLVILETVAEEVKHNNLSVYRRLQRLLKHER